MSCVAQPEARVIAKPDWPCRQLGDLCRIELGSTPARGSAENWDGARSSGNVWLSIADMPTELHAVASDSREYVSDIAAKKMRLIPEGTLLVSFKLTLGRLCYAGRELFTNEAIASLRDLDSSQVCKEYLYWYLTYFNWEAFSAGDHKIKGKTLNKAKLKALSVILPPLEEQKRIVAVLDRAFAALDQARPHAVANLSDSHELFQVYRDHLLLQASKKASSTPLGEVCEFVRGPFGGSLKKSIFKPTGYAVYEQQHAIRGQFEEFRYFVDDAKFRDMRRFRVKSGDLIMSCSGTMGKVATVPKAAPDGIINQALLKLTPKKALLAGFLQQWMESSSFQSQLSSNTQGVAIKNVASVKTLKTLTVPLVPVLQQERLLEKINDAKNRSAKLANAYSQKIEDIADLRQSILQKAFAGQLT